MKLKFSSKIEQLKNYLKKQIEKNDENQDIFKKMLEELEANPNITYKDLVIGEQNNPTKREKDNLEALELLKKIQKGEIQVTNEIKEKLAKYTGNGGTSTGSKDEYYTPKYVAQNSWKLFNDLNKNSVILDPSSGTGIFSQSKLKDVRMINIEIQSTSAGINKILNPNDEVINASFEEASKDIEDNSIDGVITNVPFMSRDMTLDTDSFFNDVTRLEDYFIIKSLQKLKYGKRAIFILPTGVIDNTQRKRIKQKMLNYGSFLGAIRLPNKVFSHTGANVSVDIAVFEKHPKNVILALKQGLIINGGLNKYIYKNELNNQFLNGIYFEKHTKNVLGVLINTKTFMESKFYDNHTKGTQVLTTDDLNTIKDKLNIKINELQTNLKNTTEYNKIEISEGVNVLSAEAGEMIYANDELLAKFNDYNSLEKIRQIELKNFYKIWSELNSINNRQLLFIHKLVNNNILSSIIAINGAKSKDKVNYKEALNIFNAIELLKVLKDKKELDIENDSKKLAKLNETLRVLFNKKNTSKFKTKEKEVRYSKMYNEEIEKLLSDIRMFLMKWDFDNLEFIDFDSEIPPLKSLTFDDIASFNENKVVFDEEKGVSYIELSELKNHKDDLLKNDDVIIIDNKVYPFKTIAKYGRKFNEAKKELENLKYIPNDIVTKKEFEEKKEKLLIYLDSFRKTISIDKLNITFTNKHILLTPNALNIAKQWFDREIKSFYIETPFAPKMTDKNSDFEKFGDRISNSVSTYTAKDTNPFYKLTPEEKEKLDNTFNLLQDNAIKETWNKFISDGRDPLMKFELGYIKKDYPILFSKETFYKIQGLISAILDKRLKEFNIKFDTFCKQHPIIRKELEKKANETSLIGISAVLNSKAGTIHSLKKFMNTEWVEKAHGYQNEDINKFSETLNGVVASQTGLGKSLIAFGTALKSLSTGAVKRVLFVVPNGVFDKWKMEVTKGRFDDNKVRTAQPLLREDKKDIVMFLDKKKYHEDYQTFIKNKNKRILFVTYDQLKQFKFKEETLKEFMPESDKDFQARTGQVKMPGYIPEFSPADWKIVQTAKNPIGYFEDGQFDLAIYDEAQYAKNAIKGGYSLKFASSITSSEVGVKSMFISAYLKRARHNGLDRGTILVTATPFTNTPYEIFVTLKKLGKLDFIKDYKAFQDTFMEVTEDELKSDLTENMLKVKIFRGLKNIDMLENMGGLDLISYRTAENEAERDVNYIDKTNLKPDSEIFTTSVKANDEVMDIKSEYVNLYELAKDYLKDKAKDESLKPPKELLNYDEKEIEKLAIPFNLLAKIDNLSRGTDLAKGYLILNLVNVDDDKLIEKVIKDLKKKKVDDYEYQEVIVKGEMVSKKVTIKKTLEELAEEKNIVIYDSETKLLTIPTLDSKILIDTLNKFENFENILDLNRFPKYKNMLININQELQNVENAKQIIFSLSITGAGIIEKLVKDYFKELEIKKYFVLSTKNIEKDKKEDSDNDDTGELSKLQEKYNNSNVVTALVFTKATSTGVDFNNRTCAIHLLDIPYTPDVWEQAKGRAIRQGNPIKNVSVYTYLMEGTFDKAKVKIMSSKTAWQNDLLNSIGSGVAEISNVAIDEDIINKAIKEYGVNFTDKQLDNLIKEEKNKQNEAIQKQRDVKKNLLKDNIKELVENNDYFKNNKNGIDNKLLNNIENLTKIKIPTNLTIDIIDYFISKEPQKETGKISKTLLTNIENIVIKTISSFSNLIVKNIDKDNEFIINEMKKNLKSLTSYSSIVHFYVYLMLKGKEFEVNEEEIKLLKDNLLELWGNKFEILQKQFIEALNNKLNLIKDNYLMYKNNDKILKDTLESFRQLADNEEDFEFIDKIIRASNPDYVYIEDLDDYIHKNETCFKNYRGYIYEDNKTFIRLYFNWSDSLKTFIIEYFEPVSEYHNKKVVKKPNGYDDFVKELEQGNLKEHNFYDKETYNQYLHFKFPEKYIEEIKDKIILDNEKQRIEDVEDDTKYIYFKDNEMGYTGYVTFISDLYKMIKFKFNYYEYKDNKIKQRETNYKEVSEWIKSIAPDIAIKKEKPINEMEILSKIDGVKDWKKGNRIYLTNNKKNKGDFVYLTKNGFKPSNSDTTGIAEELSEFLNKIIQDEFSDIEDVKELFSKVFDKLQNMLDKVQNLKRIYK